ncbi:MAG: T9SS type A sorting domain-containing protein [candidate division KSB1 bacterium]|nr:T9SS type A sorting domain-containing protein [candidate division KSB1 bacterium]MDZ7303666.1 T9SS type A sorting domain-containing protein [candidate division KSB1 bacterium]MDZ7313314.1 T9SS type A sorting domain-containing protein [candidate division KSB1 bacterium]
MKTRFSFLALAALLLATLNSRALFAQFYEIKHETVNAYGWFGGDNRPNQRRTVGVGQSVLIDTAMTVRNFAFYFRGPFDYAANPEGRGHAVTLTLNVRDATGAILKTLPVAVADTFSAGWVTWSGINLAVAANTTLIFTCYLVGGFDVNPYTASHGADANQGYVDGVRYGKNGMSDADMEAWTDWVVHPSWDSAFRLQGTLISQSPTNVRGWYADGQVWILWDLDNSPPETYAIYSSPAPFTNINQAQLIGRLYEEEWAPFALRTQINPNANYVIPNGQGGLITLPPNTGLFVETVHESGAKYYAVVKWGETAITNNITPNPISYTYDVNDPVECHPQVTATLPSGHRATAYYMWADGRDNHWEGRPDFPIMANRHKNGMPSFFIVSEAKNLPPGKVSAVHWLHGGEGTARQSLPASRASINIEPQDGLLVAYNDDLVRKIVVNSVVRKLGEGSNSWWFGWAKNLDPFDNIRETPADDDTVINYTQRRLLWINDWLIKNRNVDAERVAIQGHSVGSAGTTAMAKAFPNVFATACIFNNGFGGPIALTSDTTTGTGGVHILGTSQQNLPTNLRNYRGEVVRAYDLFNLSTPIAKTRDMPLMRSWHGKNDDSGTMMWDAYVVAEYRRADSMAWGMQLFWDERPHSIENLQSHWSHGPGNAQTERDDAAYQVRYRANQSFPAFYNHQKYPGSNKDPGDGTRGTGGTGVGDDWGSFGGYHDWDVNSIVDTPSRWEVTAYLIGLSSHLMDNSPDTSLTSDLAIRKPQQFLPPPNTLLSWLVVSLTTGDTLQRGTTIVDADGLVKVDSITVYRDPERVRIIFTTQTPTSVNEKDDRLPEQFALHQNYPNPFNPSTVIGFQLPVDSHVTLKVFDVNGREVATLVNGQLEAGKHNLVFKAGHLPSGVYFIRLTAGQFTQIRKAALIK